MKPIDDFQFYAVLLALWLAPAGLVGLAWALW